MSAEKRPLDLEISKYITMFEGRLCVRGMSVLAVQGLPNYSSQLVLGKTAQWGVGNY